MNKRPMTSSHKMSHDLNFHFTKKNRSLKLSNLVTLIPLKQWYSLFEIKVENHRKSLIQYCGRSECKNFWRIRIDDC